jgi:hypothetical protein
LTQIMFSHIPITNEDCWKATLDQWTIEAQARGDEGVFLASEIENYLRGLKQLTEREKNLHSYFMVKKGVPYASSIIEVSHALPQSDKPWLKLLNLTLRPGLLPKGDDSEEILKEGFSVIAFSVTHAVELIFHELPATKLKIYGRTTEMISFFKGIISSGFLDAALDAINLNMKIESNWLVIAKNER